MDCSGAQQNRVDATASGVAAGERGGLPQLMPAEVVHEFSNLLTIVLGNLAGLRQHVLDDRGRRHLEQAENAAYRAGQLLHPYIGTGKTRADR